jgi:hypothetical protein
MTTVIRVGDKVTWQHKASENARITPLKIIGCKVLAIYDRDGKAVATIDTPIGKADAWADDLTLEKPDKTTILSGG